MRETDRTETPSDETYQPPAVSVLGSVEEFTGGDDESSPTLDGF